ncbi:L-rhamnose operon regulatory protein rhaS [Serratia quinivorans]|nr:L-rhamnose operon regulatory protein rhaS [Serratia quinivorans]CAI2140218.1 L-rhamnose operon regulatory protein rhaS [Serratia quinivorans]
MKKGAAMSGYKAFETLREHKARLHNSVRLGSGVELAAWSNCNDRITQERADHHTLSLYVADGYECYQKVPGGWKNGGGPDRFCIMPRQYESTWDVRSDLSFVHLYCTDRHLRQVAEQTWDRSPAAINLESCAFGEDPQITLLYRQFLLNCNWQERSNQLALSSATTLLMSHLIQRYSQLQWALPQVRGGLAPAVARRVKEYIEQHLDQPLLLADLAAQAGLSEFHFARMFKHETGLAPHQFVMRARLQQAEKLLRHSLLPLTQIALECGFSSSSHFSNRFKAVYGFAPTQMRQGR